MHDRDEIVAINVTPLVDVSLVLLIVFMITARLVVAENAALRLDLLKPAPRSETQTILSVELGADGRTLADGKRLASDEDVFQIARATRTSKDLRCVIKADAAVPHGRVIHVLDLLQQAGATKVTFGR